MKKRKAQVVLSQDERLARDHNAGTALCKRVGRGTTLLHDLRNSSRFLLVRHRRRIIALGSARKGAGVEPAQRRTNLGQPAVHLLSIGGVVFGSVVATEFASQSTKSLQTRVRGAGPEAQRVRVRRRPRASFLERTYRRWVCGRTVHWVGWSPDGRYIGMGEQDKYAIIDVAIR